MSVFKHSSSAVILSPALQGEGPFSFSQEKGSVRSADSCATRVSAPGFASLDEGSFSAQMNVGHPLTPAPLPQGGEGRVNLSFRPRPLGGEGGSPPALSSAGARRVRGFADEQMMPGLATEMKTPLHTENRASDNSAEAHSIFHLPPSAYCLLPSAFCLLFFLLAPGVAAAGSKTKNPGPVTVPELELEGGRRLRYEGSISSEKQVRSRHRFWGRVLDVVAGEPEFHALINPYSVVTDSRGRIIVTDPGAGGIHIFDFTQHKYKFISREKDKDGLDSPQCVAVDAEDNIYVTDSYTGKIFVFDANGKFQHVLGSLRGEGYFKRATGIAVDSAAQRIYVTDTLRHQIWVLDMQGNICAEDRLPRIGQWTIQLPHGIAPGGPGFVGRRRHELPRAGSGPRREIPICHRQRWATRRATCSGPRESAVDSEGHLYVVEGLSGLVQVFDRQGRLLYYFGQKGSGFGEFQLPTGLFIDRNDRVFVVDSYNRRVQVFQYFALGKQ